MITHFQTLLIFLVFIWIVCVSLDWRAKNAVNDSYVVIAAILTALCGFGYMLVHNRVL